MAIKVVFLLVFVTFVSLNCAAPPSGRIVGGSFARDNQFPFQISLRRRGSHTCGGSIYNAKYIITASHCVINSLTGKPYPASDFTVVAGSNNLKQGGVSVGVKRIVSHENYGDFKNDIALLELSQSLKFSASVQAIQIHSGNIPSGSEIIISGWGRIYTGGPISDQLKFNTMKAIPQPECGKKVGNDHPGLICIGHSANNGACNGDSGGPAILNGKLVGVANFVISGCGSANPDGYALVPYYLNWIKSKAV